MREIKFRAWEKEGKLMIEDWTSKAKFDVYGFWSENKYIYMQYTGMKGKSGDEIYEDDLIQDYDEGYLWRVYFSDGQYRAESGDCDEPLSEFENDCDVVGNIYENPELVD